jgi:cyanophycinase
MARHRRLAPLAVALILFAAAGHAAGVLVLAGGGSEGDIGETQAWSAELYSPLVAEAPGAPEAPVRLVVLAATSQTPYLPRYFTWLGELAGREVIASNLIVPDRTAAQDPALVGVLAEADALFIKGGDQGRYYDAWNDTLLEGLVLDLHARGGAIGGTSAGAMSLAGFCLCGEQDLISSDVMADAHHPRLDDRDTPGGSGIHGDFFSLVGGAYVETHYTERGRLGRLIGVFAKAAEDSGGEARLAVGLENATGIVVRDGVASVIGEGAVSFVTTTDETVMVRTPGAPVHVTNLRLDRLTQGWRYDLAALAPDVAMAPADTEAVTWRGPGEANVGAWRVSGASEADVLRFEWVLDYHPDPYALARTPLPRFVRDAVGHTDTDVNDGRRGDRQATLFRALYDDTGLSAFAMYAPLAGETAQGSRLMRLAASPDLLLPGGDMATVVVDGATITHRGLAPAVNYYGIRSASLVGATVHALAPLRTGAVAWDSRAHRLITVVPR